MVKGNLSLDMAKASQDTETPQKLSKKMQIFLQIFFFNTSVLERRQKFERNP